MKPFYSIRAKIFLSTLLIILLSYSCLIVVTVKSINESLAEKIARDLETAGRRKTVAEHGKPLPSILTREDLISIREEYLGNVFISGIVSIFLSFAIAYLVARKLTGPLRELSRGAQRIESGDFTYRVGVDSDDEFGVLAASFNKMTETLSERQMTIRKKALDLEVLNKCLHELNEQLEHKVAERTTALEMEKERLEAILTSMAEGVVVTDRGNRVILFNPAAQKILGLFPHQLIGRNIEEVFDADGLGQIVDMVEEVRKGDHLAEVRDKQVGIQGKKLRVNLSPLLDHAWDFAGVVMSIRDVTIEDEIDRMKTDFISTVSHELKTPLTSMKGSLQIILRRDERLEETERELLVICQRNTDRLIRLINDILDISKIESGKMEFRFKPESVYALVAEGIGEMTSFALECRVEIVNMVSKGLPLVYGDHDRLIQVVNNLLSNAVKFSPTGERVTVSAEKEGASVAVSITDAGKVIKRTERDKLFKKFQQLHGHEAGVPRGTGLGLAICKEIIEKHRGRIYYKAKMGGGNIFTFTVPVYEGLHGAQENTDC